MTRGKPEFSRRERQIMDAVYKLGEATVAEVLAAIDDASSYSSLRKLMGLLVEKGHLSYREDGPRYIYTPTLSLEKARTGAVRQLLNTFFEGSLAQAVQALLGASPKKLSREELDELSALIQAERKKGR
ncbi:MAG: BlaI/MecI/CopY family transcriptional regulator [Vitreimonas sp.]